MRAGLPWHASILRSPVSGPWMPVSPPQRISIRVRPAPSVTAPARPPRPGRGMNEERRARPPASRPCQSPLPGTSTSRPAGAGTRQLCACQGYGPGLSRRRWGCIWRFGTVSKASGKWGGSIHWRMRESSRTCLSCFPIGRHIHLRGRGKASETGLSSLFELTTCLESRLEMPSPPPCGCWIDWEQGAAGVGLVAEVSPGPCVPATDSAAKRLA